MSANQTIRAATEANEWLLPPSSAETVPFLSLVPQAPSRLNHGADVPVWVGRMPRPARALREESSRLFADHKLARDETAFWETVVYAALGASGLSTLALSVFGL